MIIDQRLWELIHEYKLVQIQAQVHLSNNRIDSYIDCIDMLNKIQKDMEKRSFELEREIIVFLNVN